MGQPSDSYSPSEKRSDDRRRKKRSDEANKDLLNDPYYEDISSGECTDSSASDYRPKRDYRRSHSSDYYSSPHRSRRAYYSPRDRSRSPYRNRRREHSRERSYYSSRYRNSSSRRRRSRSRSPYYSSSSRSSRRYSSHRSRRSPSPRYRTSSPSYRTSSYDRRVSSTSKRTTSANDKSGYAAYSNHYDSNSDADYSGPPSDVDSRNAKPGKNHSPKRPHTTNKGSPDSQESSSRNTKPTPQPPLPPATQPPLPSINSANPPKAPASTYTGGAPPPPPPPPPEEEPPPLPNIPPPLPPSPEKANKAIKKDRLNIVPLPVASLSSISDNLSPPPYDFEFEGRCCYELFDIIKQIGEGTYGQVFKAKIKDTGWC